ncbi:hypothetical protein [Faecalicatena contorta]|uniref:hypothetical protein n=1 Tax=Faecalicatena contorta TaxID=39482 RepID=UPI001F1D9926|nr:hypothetical protein [Faecalicatena contorta]MCF2681782.1 hypothetical protein [Faecalicatena contorta]
MTSVVGVLLVVCVGLFAAGLIGRSGTESLAEIDANVAATMAMLVVFSFLLLSFSSLSELAQIFSGICGGIPYLSDIADYGSLAAMFHTAPLKAAESFMDVVFMSAIINIISLLPLTSGSAVGKLGVKIFTGMILGIISLIILNYVIKGSGPYQYITALIGAGIALIAVGSVPAAIISVLKKNESIGVGALATLLIFSKSKVVGILRDSFLKAIVFVWAIYFLEVKFGSLANFMSQMSALSVIAGPALIMIAGLVFLFYSVFGKKHY